MGSLLAFFAVTTLEGAGVLLLLGVVLYGIVVYFVRPRGVAQSGASSTPMPPPTADTARGVTVAGSRWTLPFRPFDLVAIVVAIYLLTQLAAILALSLVLLLLGYSMERADELVSNSSLVQFAFILLIDGMTIALVYWLLKRRGGSMRAIGLVRPRFTDVGYAAVTYVMYFGALLVALGLIRQFVPGIDWDQRQELGFDTSASGLGLVPVFISLVVLPPLAEEIITRGLLYSGLRSKLPFLTAALITSVLFAVPHLQIGSGNPLLWAAAIDTFILSLALVALRERTGSLWPCILLHAIKNGLAFTYLFIIRPL